MKVHLLGLAVLVLCVAARPSAAEVVHRWSFNENANDSAASAHATLQEGATTTDGKVHFDGEAAYVELPIGETIAGLTNATFEAWSTWDDVQGPWARIFDFGTGQQAYMFLTPRHGRPLEGSAENSIRFAISTAGFGGEQTLNSPEQFPVGEETHIVVTIDADNDVAKLYVNGELVATREETTTSPSDLGNTPNNWLGAGQFFELDPAYDGSISEFRIHNAALSAEEVAMSFQLGPDKLEPDPPAAGDGAGCCCQRPSHHRGKGRIFGGLFGRRCR